MPSVLVSPNSPSLLVFLLQIVRTIDPEKDIDALSVHNTGLLAQGEASVIANKCDSMMAAIKSTG